MDDEEEEEEEERRRVYSRARGGRLRPDIHTLVLLYQREVKDDFLHIPRVQEGVRKEEKKIKKLTRSIISPVPLSPGNKSPGSVKLEWEIDILAPLIYLFSNSQILKLYNEQCIKITITIVKKERGKEEDDDDEDDDEEESNPEWSNKNTQQKKGRKGEEGE
ncbi:hypothetical protein HYALB_00002022 [Hymenoscyphus albidus]|uniref:Uncharacterized protein n=1 Tax=Hymenoscyphus albidus TaxID=595503 RepID=A0A9N9LFK6_9HELO|nr:hypothetical protein HYALB_00002022 [Hymenoscyphus albidus]